MSGSAMEGERSRLLFCALLAILLTTSLAGEYCDDFEDGDFGVFWEQTALDQCGRWKASSYSELRKTIPQFPEPASGDTVVYLTPNEGCSYVSANLRMVTAYQFPAGSNMTFRYWLQAEWPSASTLEVRRYVGTQEEPKELLSLTDQSGPNNLEWATASLDIPPLENGGFFKIEIFGAESVGEKGNIAIDDIIISGPDGISKQCGLVTTTDATTRTTVTTEPTTTTAAPSTTTTVRPPTISTTPAPSPMSCACQCECLPGQ